MSYPLPTIKRFQSEDYKDSPSWFHRFIQAVNLYTEPMFNLVNGNLALSANVNEEIYSFQITSGATAAGNTYLFSPKRLAGAPSGVVIAQCLPVLAVPTAVGNPVTLDWVWNGTQIQILAIYGLTNGVKYDVKVRIF